MDEELEGFLPAPTFMAEETGFDFDYEFDAPQYYDFTRPETLLEAREAERWFQSAESYPPSPFIVKLNWVYQISEETVSTSCNSKDDEVVDYVGDDSDVKMECEASATNRNKIDQDVTHSKTRSSVKSSPSRNSTFMKPTASYLAKHNQLQEAQFHQYLRRHPRLLTKTDNSSQNSSVIENQATKRQKLEAGYLRKVSHLKHQAFFLHKVSRKVGLVDVSSVHARSKVTIPKEPILETAQRAQRHRTKVNAEQSEDAKANASTFKARPLNKKILGPSLSLSKKSTIPQTEFHVFHLRTSERARQHASNHVATVHNCNSTSQDENKDSRRMNSCDNLNKDKCEAAKKSKHHPLRKKEYNCPIQKSSVNEPPIALFSKLSLAPEHDKSQSKLPLSPKGLKENAPGSYLLQNEATKVVKETSPRFAGNRLPCGIDRRFTEVGGRFPISRNLDIR